MGAGCSTTTQAMSARDNLPHSSSDSTISSSSESACVCAAQPQRRTEPHVNNFMREHGDTPNVALNETIEADITSATRPCDHTCALTHALAGGGVVKLGTHEEALAHVHVGDGGGPSRSGGAVPESDQFCEVLVLDHHRIAASTCPHADTSFASTSFSAACAALVPARSLLPPSTASSLSTEEMALCAALNSSSDLTVIGPSATSSASSSSSSSSSSSTTTATSTTHMHRDLLNTSLADNDTVVNAANVLRCTCSVHCPVHVTDSSLAMPPVPIRANSAPPTQRSATENGDNGDRISPSHKLVKLQQMVDKERGRNSLHGTGEAIACTRTELARERRRSITENNRRRRSLACQPTNTQSTLNPDHMEVFSLLPDPATAKHEAAAQFALYSFIDNDHKDSDRVSERVATKDKLLLSIAHMYSSKGVTLDEQAVNRWIDMSLRGLGKDSGPGTRLSEQEFVMFFSCCEVFANAKLREKNEKKHRRTNSRGPTSSVFERHVFLGGSCNPTTWRQDIAIPCLRKHNVRYYNPQTAYWHPEMMESEAQAKDECHVLLFVIDSQTRSIASMLEAVEYIVNGRDVVMVIESISCGQEIENQPITGRQLTDLNRAREYLKDIIKRYPENARLFATLPDALQHILDQKCPECASFNATGGGGTREMLPALFPVRGYMKQKKTVSSQHLISANSSFASSTDNASSSNLFPNSSPFIQPHTANTICAPSSPKSTSS